jgi:hypothetical protein
MIPQFEGFNFNTQGTKAQHFNLEILFLLGWILSAQPLTGHPVFINY